MTTYTDQLFIGQRVYCSLWFAGVGIIYAIDGEQAPSSVQGIGGVGFAGGNAKINVVFEQGSISEKLPEGLLRSSGQWSILEEEPATDEEIQAALKYARQEAKKAKAKKHMQKQAFYAQQRALLQDPALRGLKRANQGENPEKVAAANIRKELKAAFPGVKFSVRKSSGALAIRWTDGPTLDAVDAIAERYKSGSFDSMQDLHTTTRSPFNTLFGDVDFLNLSRDLSDELTTRAIDAVWARYEGNLRDMAKPTAQDVKTGDWWRVEIPRLQETVAVAVRKEAHAIAA